MPDAPLLSGGFHDGLRLDPPAWFFSWVFDSHCFPYVVYERRNKLTTLTSEGHWFGLPVIISGVLVFFIGKLAFEWFTMEFSILIVVAGSSFTYWIKSFQTPPIPSRLSLLYDSHPGHSHEPHHISNAAFRLQGCGKFSLFFRNPSPQGRKHHPSGKYLLE